MNLSFLVSGGGGSLRAVYHAFELLGLPVHGLSVVADRDCGAVEFARDNGIDCVVLEYDRIRPNQLRDQLQKSRPEVVVTTIHKIIDEDTLALIPARFINLHYSLLPSFAGLIGMKTLSAARERNIRIIGATSHEVIPEVDAGAALCQGAMACDWETDDTRLLEDCIFRIGCLCLLNALLPAAGFAGKTGTDSMVDIGRDRKALFAPHLYFDPSILDPAYWKRVSHG